MFTIVKRQHTLGFSGVQEKTCNFFAVGFICAQGKKTQPTNETNKE